MLDVSDEDVVVIFIAFHPYSAVRGYAKGFSYVLHGRDYDKRVKKCNHEKVCELSLIFPNEGILLYAPDLRVQYIGTSEFTTRITFNQHLAPAYYAEFQSSICYTLPQLCTCIRIQLKYSNTLSHFVHEANRVDSDFMPTSEWYEPSRYDISFASSLIVNLSLCEGRYPRTWWLLTFHYDQFFAFSLQQISRFF